jgi:methylthioxylose transferase
MSNSADSSSIERATTPAGWQRVIALAARRASVSQLVTAVALATVAVGLTVHAIFGGLGAGEPPFISAWHPRIRPTAAISAAVLAAGALIAAASPARIRSPALFAAWAFGLALMLGLALNLAREGVHGWYAVFDTSPSGSFEASNEYLPSLPALSYGPRFFLDHFAELVPSLSVNGAGHPPGLLLTMDALGLRTARTLAAFCIATGALSAPLAYVLGRDLLGEERGRTAALLTAFAPSALLYGTVSADAVYMTLGMATAALLVARRPGTRTAGAAMAALAALFSWLLLAIPVWAALVVFSREGLRAALGVCVTCMLAVLALNGALALTTGYDPIGALQATGTVYRESLAVSRPYAYWVFGSPTAWAVMLGLPTAALAVRATARRDPAAVALATIVIVSAVLGFSKAETERIWLPYVPLACIAAASAAPPRLDRILAALAVQALLVEILLDTIW